MNSYGFIETVGLTTSVVVADIAVKSSYVEVVGFELAKGSGYTTVKIEGSVSSVEAAIDAVTRSIEVRDMIVSTNIIPRPDESLKKMIFSDQNLDESLEEEEEESTQEVEDIEEEPEAVVDSQEAEKLEEVVEEVIEETKLEEDLVEDEEPVEVKEVAEAKVVEIEKVKAEKEAKAEAEVKKSEEDVEEYTCNLCNDPECQRHKGEPRKLCIHFKN